VPASSANLGPGFDCMAAALALHIELEVIETGEFAVDTDLPRIRFVMDPLKPVFQGTRRIRESRVDE